MYKEKRENRTFVFYEYKFDLQDSKDRMGGDFMKKYKKVLIGIGIILFVVIAACALEYALYYRSHSIIKSKEIQTKGCLLFGTNFETIEVVDVEIKVQELSYLFGNQEDAVQGTIWVNGQNIFSESADEGEPGFYTVFHEDTPDLAVSQIGDMDSRCNRICISNDLETIVCGLSVDASISKEVKNPSSALLVVYAETKEEAEAQLEKVSTHPAMKTWLDEKEYIYSGKEEFLRACAEHQGIYYLQALEQHEEKYKDILDQITYATCIAEAVSYETSAGWKGGNFVAKLAYVRDLETDEIKVLECYVLGAYMPKADYSKFKCGGYNIDIDGNHIRISATGQFEFESEEELEVSGDIISNKNGVYVTKVKTGVMTFSGDGFK